MRAWLPLIGAAAVLGGCINLAPDYQRPAAPVPAQWTDASKVAGPQATQLAWRQFLRDPRLQRTVAQALANNRDLRVAVLDIEKARATYRIQDAALLPSIGLTAGQDAERTPTAVKSASAGVSRVNSVELGFSAYELDLFGRVHSLSQEALETYLSTIDSQRSTQITLVSEVANDWLTLAADRRLLALARQTQDSQQRTYTLVQQEHALGATDGLELAEAQSSLQSARNDVAVYTAQATQARDALELVVGAQVAPGDLPDAQVDAVSSLTDLPAGVPSTVLQQRPDVLSAEHALKAANADIGAARANFFPRISLTAALGSESSALSGLFGGGSRAWSFAPSVTLPIFDAGANRATLAASKASREIAVATYEKTLQTAFAEVADSLATRATIAERLDAQDQTVAADQRAYDLSMALYRQGSYSLLDTLTQQRLLYTAQQAQVQTQLAAQTSLVTLYKALGGGFEQTDMPAVATAL